MGEPEGTITPNPDFRDEWAAERFKKAMRGIGSDEKMIIRMLTIHDSIQREEIERKYKSKYGRDLIEDLKLELGGHFEDTVVALLTSKYDLLVNALNDSFQLVGADAQTLTEILCCRDVEDINSLAWWYESTFDRTLESEISSHLSGEFKQLMRSLLWSERPSDDEEVDIEKAKEDAQALYDAGVGYSNATEGGPFIDLFVNRSYAHLRKVFEEYENITGDIIEKDIQSEFKGDVREGLLAIVNKVKDLYGFFAQRLNMSMRGIGTDDKTLIRIIVSRSEEDLVNIKARYLEMYGTSLANDIKDDTAGDYAKLLLAIVNKND